MSNSSISVQPADNSAQHKWDRYVTANPTASPYHLFAWKLAIEEAYQHQGYYFYAEKDGQIVGVLPLIHFHIPFLLNEFNSLPFCDIGNILADNEDVFRMLLEKNLSLCEEKRIRTVNLRGSMPSFNHQEGRLSQVKHDKVRMLLELPEDSKALMKSFKSKLRSQIRKSEKNGLDFTWGNKADIEDYYTVFSENMRDLGSPVHSKKWFLSILKYYGNSVKMGLVRYNGNAVACCMLLRVGHKIAIPWASTLRKYNKLAPNMLLYWNALKYSADSGCSSFDFGRSSLGEGTFKFKKQWGAEPRPLDWYKYSKSNNSGNLAEATSNKMKKEKIAAIWTRLPTPFANFIGPKIRKYISL